MGRAFKSTERYGSRPHQGATQPQPHHFPCHRRLLGHCHSHGHWQHHSSLYTAFSCSFVSEPLEPTWEKRILGQTRGAPLALPLGTLQWALFSRPCLVPFVSEPMELQKYQTNKIQFPSRQLLLIFGFITWYYFTGIFIGPEIALLEILIVWCP